MSESPAFAVRRTLLGTLGCLAVGLTSPAQAIRPRADSPEVAIEPLLVQARDEGFAISVVAVVIDSALGLLGAPPKDRDEFLGEVRWLIEYVSAKRAPPYPFAIDTAGAARGKQVFEATCAGCHASARTGTVIPLAEVGTSPDRIGTWNERAAREANAVVEDMGIERAGLVEEPLSGYVAAFLDGIWLRAPYLHNGSVPSLRDLLEPAAQRPTTFWRGYDLYDPDRVGFVTRGPEAERTGTLHDVAARGGGNRGHEFGTTLPAADKADLLEYLKTM